MPFNHSLSLLLRTDIEPNFQRSKTLSFFSTFRKVLTIILLIFKKFLKTLSVLSLSLIIFVISP